MKGICPAAYSSYFLNRTGRDKPMAEKKTKSSAKDKADEKKKGAQAEKKPSEAKPKKSGATVFATSVAFIIVALIAVGFYVYMNLSGFSKAAVESLASKTLGVPVTIAEMEVNLDEMSVLISGLRVGNMPGFASENIMEVGTINVSAQSLSREKVVFDDIIVSDSVIYLDIHNEKTNLYALSENIKAKEAQPESAANDNKPVTKVVVNRLLIENAKLEATSNLPDVDVRPVTLPDISGSIGRETGGVTPEKAVREVGLIVTKVALRRAIRTNLIDSLVEKKLDDAVEKLGIEEEAVDSIKNNIRSMFQ